MKINKEKLIELLVDKTGMDQPSVEDQLDQLIKRIIDAAERGKALEIKEFGLFYFDENGDLKFDPAKELSTEINFKYAGMEPVELKPPRDSAVPESDKEEEIKKEEIDGPEPAVQEEKSEKEEPADDIFGLEKEEKSESENDFDEIEEPPSDSPIISKADKVERDQDPFSGLLGDASSKMGKKGEEKPEEEFQDQGNNLEKLFSGEADSEFQDEEELFDEVLEDEGQDKEEPASVAPKPKENRTTKDPITVVMSVVLVFVLVAAGFFIIPVLFQESEQPTEEVTEQIPEEIMQTDTPETLTPVEPVEESEVIEEVEEDVIPEEIEPERPRYGLTGSLVDSANDGFSIVLYSLASEENARAQASALAADNYRVIVNPRVVNNNTVWRVSVGQFPSIEAAQEVARELPEPYNSNNFIQRIQTN